MLIGLERIESTETRFPPVQLVREMVSRLTDVGRSESQPVSWSASNRYDFLADFFLHNDVTTDKNLLALRERLLQKPLRIQECAVGEGQALEGFLVKLLPLLKKSECWIHDIAEPITIMRSDVLARLRLEQHIQFEMTQRDIREPPKEPDFFSLSIVGYVHPYLSPYDLMLAIQNRAAESQLTAIIPGDGRRNMVQSVALLYRGEDQQWLSSYLWPIHRIRIHR